MRPAHPRLVPLAEHLRHDALTSPVDALDVIGAIAARPPATEVICVHLDGRRRVAGAFAVTGIPDPDRVVEVAAVALDAAAGFPDLDGLLLASIRPESGGADPHDEARWEILDALCAEAGVELVEWLVVTPRAVSLPRAAGGTPDRWPRLAVPPG